MSTLNYCEIQPFAYESARSAFSFFYMAELYSSQSSGYSQSASLLAHSRITASQFIRWDLYPTWYKQVPTHHLMICTFEAGDLLDSIKIPVRFLQPAFLYFYLFQFYSIFTRIIFRWFCIHIILYLMSIHIFFCLMCIQTIFFRCDKRTIFSFCWSPHRLWAISLPVRLPSTQGKAWSVYRLLYAESGSFPFLCWLLSRSLSLLQIL